MYQYKFKFYLNAVHAIKINGVEGQQHPHTWEIGIETYKSSNTFIMFGEIEESVESFLSTYQDKVLNTVPPFDITNPTLENVSFFLKDKLDALLIQKGWILIRIEVSETPSRSFVIDVQDEVQEKINLVLDEEKSFTIVESEADKVFNDKYESYKNQEK